MWPFKELMSFGTGHLGHKRCEKCYQHFIQIKIRLSGEIALLYKSYNTLLTLLEMPLSKDYCSNLLAIVTAADGIFQHCNKGAKSAIKQKQKLVDRINSWIYLLLFPLLFSQSTSNIYSLRTYDIQIMILV